MAMADENFIPELETQVLPEENALERLKRYSMVGIDSACFDEMLPFYPRWVTTNPTLLLRAIESGGQQYGDYFEKICEKARREIKGSEQMKVDKAMLDALVSWGTDIVTQLPHGFVSTQVDPRLTTAEDMVTCAQGIVNSYSARAVNLDHVLIKIPATPEGIKAIKQLSAQGFHINTTMVFSLEQAVCAADAGATVVSPFIGRVSDYWKQHGENFTPENDPGVKLARKIYQYFRAYKYSTKVLVASFRNLDQVFQLVGSDILSLPLNMMKDIVKAPGGAVSRKLHADDPAPCDRIDIKPDGWKLPADAQELLDAGMKMFADDTDKLEGHARQIIRRA